MVAAATCSGCSRKALLPRCSRYSRLGWLAKLVEGAPQYGFVDHHVKPRYVATDEDPLSADACENEPSYLGVGQIVGGSANDGFRVLLGL